MSIPYNDLENIQEMINSVRLIKQDQVKKGKAYNNVCLSAFIYIFVCYTKLLFSQNIVFFDLVAENPFGYTKVGGRIPLASAGLFQSIDN